MTKGRRRDIVLDLMKALNLLSAVSDLLKTEFNLSRVSSNWYMIQ